MIPLLLALAIATANIDPDLFPPFSRAGSSIQVEDWTCTVKSARVITCTNIGRVCRHERAIEEQYHDRYFGCALDQWKAAHPGDSCPESMHTASPECQPHSFGGVRIEYDGTPR